MTQVLEMVRSFPTPYHKLKQGSSKEGIFPLPLPWGNLTSGGGKSQEWMEGVFRSINWLSTGSFAVRESSPDSAQERLLAEIRESMVVVQDWCSHELKDFCIDSFWSQKHVNSYGEEVHVAQSVRWENVTDSLPKAELAGIVDAVSVCDGGMKDFIRHPARWIKPVDQQVWMKPPAVMVPLDCWEEMVEGLIHRNICGVIPLKEVFHVGGSPILGGIFGVPKGETTPAGVPILRLIMDLRPINQNFIPLGGDLSTLPMLSQMFQLEIQPHEHLVISSEDVRAMFYIIGLPKEWAPFLGFSRIIPTRFNPPGVKGPCVLFSKVLPMGFVNSVSLAQHIHRRVVSSALKGAVSPNCEIRRDRDFPDSLQFYRVYLDNFDELTLRSKEILSCSQPSLTLLLQEEYERLGVPRNTKKGVDHAEAAELQGAWIDGVAGIAYAKVDKVSKYLRSLIEVLRAGRAS